MFGVTNEIAEEVGIALDIAVMGVQKTELSSIICDTVFWYKIKGKNK